MKRILLSSAAALAFTAGTAFAGPTAWDINKDGMVDADEYIAATERLEAFKLYDTDGNGTIDPDEFDRTTWLAYDADGDGEWSQTEAGVWEDSRIRSGGEVSK